MFTHHFSVTLICVVMTIAIKAQTKDLLEKAEQGDTEAQYKLALCYLDGQSLKEDSIEAAYLLLLSASGGGCTPEIIRYNKEKAVFQSETKLSELAQKIGSNYNYLFSTLLGCLYESKDNFSEAEKYYKKGITHGGRQAIASLGVMYFRIAMANEEYKDLMYDDYQDMSPGYSMILPNPYPAIDYKKNKQWKIDDNCIYWLENAIKNGDGDILFTYGSHTVYEILIYAYAEGRGTIQNEKKAIDVAYTALLDTTAVSQHPQMGAYAMSIIEAISDNPRFSSFLLYDDEILRKIYNLYDNTKYVHGFAAGSIGIAYYKEKKYDEAFKYLKEAAELSYKRSYKYLSECYKYGLGTNVNTQEELKWSEKFNHF